MIHLSDPGLDRLVVRADLGSSSGQRAVWFADCRLVGNVLFVPDFEIYGFIRRCFLSKLQKVITDLEIRVGVPNVEPKAKPVQPKQTLWKKGREPRQGGML